MDETFHYGKLNFPIYDFSHTYVIYYILHITYYILQRYMLLIYRHLRATGFETSIQFIDSLNFLHGLLKGLKGLVRGCEIVVKNQPYQLPNTNREFFSICDVSDLNFHQ